MGLSRSGAALGATLGLVAGAGLAGSLATELLLPGWNKEQVPLHSAMEMAGTLVALVLAGLLLLLAGHERHGGDSRVWAAAALATVGILDAYHAAVRPGELFVWLHSLSTLAGGLLFAWVWLPLPVVRHRYAALALTAVATVAAGALSVRYAGALPPMVGDGGFTPTATAVNAIGGALFLAATLRFVLEHRAHPTREGLALAGLTLLFGMSGLLFDYSEKWDAHWWFWHLLRFVAYLWAAVLVLQLFRQTLTELARSDAAVRQQRSERLEAAQRYRTLFETMEQGVVYHRADGTIVEANPAAERILGLDRDQLLGRTSHDPRWHAIHEDGSDFPPRTHPGMVALHTGEAVTDVLMGVFNPRSESYRWILISARPEFRAGENQPFRAYTAFNDVTRRFEIERALRASEERLSLALHAARAGIWDWDVRNDTVVWSRETYTLHGVDPAEPASFGLWHGCVYPEDRDATAQAVQAALEGRTADYRTEFRVNHPERGLRWLLAFGRIERDAEGEPSRILGIVLDITEAKHHEQSMRRANEELQRFAYVASHDLKAPLRAVHGLSSWIEEETAPHLSDEGRERLRLLRDRVKRMDDLINAILDYSRAGASGARVETLDSAALVHEVVDSLAPPEGFTVSVAPDLPTLRTDRLHLHQAFANLIGNAVAHHDQHNGRVWVSARDLGGFYEFAVADDGPGIPQAYLGKIFELFHQGPAPSSGTGIGLAVVRRVVEQVGGRIRVESQPGKGSTFRFTWPKVLPDGAAGEQVQSNGPAPAEPASVPRRAGGGE